MVIKIQKNAHRIHCISLHGGLLAPVADSIDLMAIHKKI